MHGTIIMCNIDKKIKHIHSCFPAIQTAAIEMLTGPESGEHSRKPDIMADAAYAILTKDSRKVTGNFFVDEEVLRNEGINDLAQYAVNPSKFLKKTVIFLKIYRD